MRRTHVTKVAGVCVLVLGAIVTALVSSSQPTYVDFAGHVYEADSTGAAPVADAVVSNNWDSNTATTNARGEFRLRVRRVAADEFVKFTARSGERTAYHLRVGSPKPTPVDIVLNER